MRRVESVVNTETGEDLVGNAKARRTVSSLVPSVSTEARQFTTFLY